MKHQGKIKILIVDDSVLFRSQIQLALKDCPEIEIVGAASHGKIALDKLAFHDVDLMTLDLEMPILDGIETIKAMKEKNLKTKVIMFSSASRSGAEKTFEAMQLGAVDFVAKPQPDGTQITPADKIKEVLLPKILSLFGMHETKRLPIPKIENSNLEFFRPEVLVIASSTGGPNALVEFCSQLHEIVPYPILIAQHMPPVFTASLAERLGAVCGKIAKEGVHGEVLQPNQIYVAPGNFHMRVVGEKNFPLLKLDQAEQRNYVRPCADYLFESAVSVYGKGTLGVVLTGMGRDGADGAKVIKQHGGMVFIQDENSSVVFGMPGAVYESQKFDYMGTPADLALKTLYVSKLRKGGHVA
jgi:two-component system chemotaxis response regulator CheB